MLSSKVVGGILLVVGTSIGGGMLALPVATAHMGLGNSILFLFFSWLIMTSGALLILEVNLHLEPGSNIISMAKATLGLPGQILAWITYLFLLYTLLAAYISQGSDLLSSFFNYIHLSLPIPATSLLFTILFGFIVYHGIRTVDYINRGLMLGKLGVYIILVFIILPHIHLEAMKGGSLSSVPSSLMILMASFGFASIVPTLRDYFDSDAKKTKVCYFSGFIDPFVMLHIVGNCNYGRNRSQ